MSGLSPKKAACKPFLVIKRERPCFLTVVWSCLLLFKLYFFCHMHGVLLMYGNLLCVGGGGGNGLMEVPQILVLRA